MAFTYDSDGTSTEPQIRIITSVRRHISDTRPEAPIFNDAEILGYLDDVSWVAGTRDPGRAMMAASLALAANATDEGRLQKKLETLEMKTDGPALVKELRAQAEALWSKGEALRDKDAATLGVQQAVSDFQVIGFTGDAFGGFY